VTHVNPESATRLLGTGLMMTLMASALRRSAV